MFGVLLLIVTIQGAMSGDEDKHTERQNRELSMQNAAYIKEIRQTLKDLEHNLKKTKRNGNNHGQSKIADNGGVYVRWGRTTCMSNSKLPTSLVYAGKVVGSHTSHQGGPVNYLCLPDDPLWDHYDSNINNNAFVVGTQYHNSLIDIPHTAWDKSKYQYQGVPCAVCQTSGRTRILMIPGRNKCYGGWIEEYHGYLGGGYNSNAAASEYQCIDHSPQKYSPKKNQKAFLGKVVNSVEVFCDGLIDCPPYVHGRELTCVVCSK